MKYILWNLEFFGFFSQCEENNLEKKNQKIYRSRLWYALTWRRFGIEESWPKPNHKPRRIQYGHLWSTALVFIHSFIHSKGDEGDDDDGDDDDGSVNDSDDDDDNSDDDDDGGDQKSQNAC